MTQKLKNQLLFIFLVFFSINFTMTAAQAQDWEVVKFSGQAWIKSEQPQKVALTKHQNS